MWNHLLGYNGLLLPLLDFIVKNELPTPQAIAEAQTWLLREMDLNLGPFPLRHNSNLRTKLNIQNMPNKPRFFTTTDHSVLPFDIIPTDNEAATSFFVEVKNGKDFSSMTILKALQNEIKVGICKNGHPPIERQIFQQFGIATTMTNHPLKISNRGFLLCHIADAANNINTNQNFDFELKERIFRMLSPLNVFPFPFHHTGKRFKYEHLINGIDVMEDLGGTTEFQNLFEAILYNYMITENLGNSHEIWYGKSGRGIQLGIDYAKRRAMYPEIIKTHALTQINIVPMNLPDRVNPPVTNRPMVGVAPPATITPMVGNSIRLYTSTRFRVTENMYQELIINQDRVLQINISRGEGVRVHPTGIYVIPRSVAISFIQSKRGTPNWNTHQNYHSVSIPVALSQYFTPVP